ncbi:hypothetical protein WG66_002338 [Moniliophthora roreri]|nr:hypothetical protein WG66_002338 [Moniliophthora roreri]
MTKMHTSSHIPSSSQSVVVPSESTPPSLIVSTSPDQDEINASDGSSNDSHESLGPRPEPSYLHWKSNNPFLPIVANAVPPPSSSGSC